MPKAEIKQEQKEQNFDAIAPLRQSPALVTTNNVQPKSKLGSIGALFLILFLVAAGISSWFYWQHRNLNQEIEELQAVSQNAQKEAIEGVSFLDKINQHILLPHNQEPKVTTIENVQELKKQETFYEYAQNGDALVQFNSLEIIYNPVADVIVNVRIRGTVAGAEMRAVQGAITIDIRNGAGIAGLAGRTSEAFKGVKEFVVQSIGNASKSGYAKTILVNLSDKDVTGLEKQFNTKSIKDLPAGEQPSSADVVIILGRS